MGAEREMKRTLAKPDNKKSALIARTNCLPPTWVKKLPAQYRPVCFKGKSETTTHFSILQVKPKLSRSNITTGYLYEYNTPHVVLVAIPLENNVYAKF